MYQVQTVGKDRFMRENPGLQPYDDEAYGKNRVSQRDLDDTTRIITDTLMKAPLMKNAFSFHESSILSHPLHDVDSNRNSNSNSIEEEKEDCYKRQIHYINRFDGYSAYARPWVIITTGPMGCEKRFAKLR